MQTTFWNPKQKSKEIFYIKIDAIRLLGRKIFYSFCSKCLVTPYMEWEGASLPHLQHVLVLSIILNPRKDKAL